MVLVTLRGANSGQGPYPFTGFKIWAEVASDFSKDETEQGDLRATADPHQPLGVFQAYDAQTKLHESCAPAVDNATAHPKTEVQVSSSKSIVIDEIRYQWQMTNDY